MNCRRSGWALIPLIAAACGCGRPQGAVEIRMPEEGTPSLAAVQFVRADGGGLVSIASNVTASFGATTPSGAYRVILAFANSNHQPPSEVEAARIEVTPGATNALEFGAIGFVVDEKLPDLNLAGILVHRTSEGPPFSLELKDFGNTYYFFKTKPLPPGTYGVALRYARSVEPSTIATGVVVGAGATAVVRLDSGLAIKKPAGPRVEGWRLTREGDSVPWLDVSRKPENDEPLWRRVIAPPGVYSLVLRRAAPAGDTPPERIVVAPGGVLVHEPVASTAP